MAPLSTDVPTVSALLGTWTEGNHNNDDDDEKDKGGKK